MHVTKRLTDADRTYNHATLVKSLMHPENPRTENAGKVADDGAACKHSLRTTSRKETH